MNVPRNQNSDCLQGLRTDYKGTFVWGGWVIEMVCILVEILIIQVHVFVKSYWSVHLRSVYFTVCKFYPQKGFFLSFRYALAALKTYSVCIMDMFIKIVCKHGDELLSKIKYHLVKKQV